MSQKIAVICYSWSGKTRVFAEKIVNQKNADIFEIKPKEPYSKIYSECVSRGNKEFDEKGLYFLTCKVKKSLSSCQGTKGD